MAVLREFTWSAIAPATSRIRRNPPLLVAAEQLGRRSPTGLLFEIDIRERGRVNSSSGPE